MQIAPTLSATPLWGSMSNVDFISREREQVGHRESLQQSLPHTATLLEGCPRESLQMSPIFQDTLTFQTSPTLKNTLKRAVLTYHYKSPTFCEPYILSKEPTFNSLLYRSRWMGGGHPGKLTVDYVHELVHAQRLHGSLPA